MIIVKITIMSFNFDTASLNLNANAKEFVPSENGKKLIELFYHDMTTEFVNKNPWIYEFSDMKKQLTSEFDNEFKQKYSWLF